MEIKLSRNVAACKLQSPDKNHTFLSEPCPSLETQSETEMEDTTCGALVVYECNDEFKIIKKKMLKEKNTDSEEEVEKTVAKSHKYPDQTVTTSAKKGNLIIVTLLVLQCLPYAAGKSFDYGKQGLQDDNCGNFLSHLSNVTGPFSLWDMCQIRRQNTQCPMPYIGRCFPSFKNNAGYHLACMINSTSLSILLKEGKCILLKTKGPNDLLVKCYEKDDCLPGVTSPKPATTNIPHVSFASTNDPLTPNATNPLPDSQPRIGYTLTAFIVVLVVAVVCFAIFVLVCYIAPWCISRFLIRHHLVRSL